jgi:hypothetical protein
VSEAATPTDALPAELLAALDADIGSVYAIDGTATITYVNPAFGAFAVANGASTVADTAVGTSLSSVIPAVLATFYADALERVFAHGLAWEHDYECSSPTVHRRFRMQIRPLPDGNLAIVTNDATLTEPLGTGGAPDPARYAANGLILQCAHCRRVRAVDGGWELVPAWIAHPPHPVSHGLCDVCLEYHYPA